MNKQNNQNNKPGFRPTPTQVADSLKILTGVKTNSTIRDLEEEEGELEEKEGVPKRKNRNVKQSRFTKEDIYEMKLLYESGISCPKIGEMFNVDKGHVVRLLKSIGVEIKDRRKTHTGFIGL